MKGKILSLFQKYNVSADKIIIFSALIILFVLRYLVQDNVIIKPVILAFDFYADCLIAIAKTILFNQPHLSFDFVNNQIVTSGVVMHISRFYFSLNQIVAVFIIALITKSPVLSKIKYFFAAVLIITLYNSIRIAIHALNPETISVHNWLFNLVLIPRWLIVLVFTFIYWEKFPGLKKLIIKKLALSEEIIRHSFIKLAIVSVIYYLVVIITFNQFFIINGNLLISFVLNTSKHFLGMLGYPSQINYRLIYGNNAALYMDDACIGIDLMFLFASFIVVIPGPVKHKLWFIPVGVSVIVMLNCLRVVLIFINITRHSKYSLPVEIHDVFTYPVLVFTLFLWIFWINHFLKAKRKLPA